MSIDASAAAAFVALSNLHSNAYCIVASCVLFIYDALVMLDRELACFWTTPLAGAPLLFFANKCISMVVFGGELVEFVYFPSDKVGIYKPLQHREYCVLNGGVCSCAVFSTVINVIQMVQFLPAAVFSTLRAYVLSKSKLLALLVLALSLAPLGANLVHLGYGPTGKNSPPFGCVGSDRTTRDINAKRFTVVLIARIPLIIADVILICITCAKLSSREAFRNLQESKRLSLPVVLFRDGLIYFIALFVLNVLHLVFSETALAGGNGGWSYITIFTAPITAILISRFLLELQEANRTVVRVDVDDPLHFANNPYDDTPSFIRSLGAVISSGPLSHDGEGDVGDPHSQLCSDAHPSRGEKSAFESSEMAMSELVPSHSLPLPACQ